MVVSKDLTAHNHPYELFVVNVSLRVLLTCKKLFHFVVVQFLAECSQQVSEFCGTDISTPVLVEVTKAFDEILGSVCAPVFAYCLQNGQEYVESYAIVWLQLVAALLYLGLRWVLTQGTENVTQLRHADLSIAAVVEQLKCFLEFDYLVLGISSHVYARLQPLLASGLIFLRWESTVIYSSLLGLHLL